MENNNIKKKVIISFTVALVISFALAALMFWYQKADNGSSTQDIYKMLCNAFFVPGVMFVGYGSLLLIAIQGNFIGFQFMMKQVGQFFAAPFVRHLKRLKYAEFKLEKEAEEVEKGKDPTRWNALVVGIINIIISLIFMMLYYKA